MNDSIGKKVSEQNRKTVVPHSCHASQYGRMLLLLRFSKMNVHYLVEHSVYKYFMQYPMAIAIPYIIYN